MAGGDLDFERLEGYFRALAFSSRLELLHLLRFPRALPEIKLSARLARPGETPGRAISRQAMQEHLDKLLDIGVVVAREGEGRAPREYVVNGQRLYQIMEEFREIGTIVQAAPAGRDATAALGIARPPAHEPGPKLVLVHGLLEGKAFPLRRQDLKEGRGWIVGRRSDLHVGLDYDPFVSFENSEIVLEGGQYRLMDLRSSRNGTRLNWRQLAIDERAPLAAGDVIGVGRSLLVFKPE